MRKFMRKKLIIIFLILIWGGIGLSGCQSVETKKFQASQSDYGSRSLPKDKHISDNRLYGPTNQGGLNHENKKLRYSKELSTAVSDMTGIYVGIVMLTDKNAYASIIFDNSATGLKARNSPDENDSRGTTRGMYDVHTGNQTAKPNQIATGINNYLTENNPDNLSSKLKQAIAITLRNENPQIEEVYITANREFINQMNVYYSESALGVDLDHYLPDFNKLVEQHFPVS